MAENFEKAVGVVNRSGNICKILAEEVMPEIQAVLKDKYNKTQNYPFRSYDSILNELNRVFKGKLFICTEILDYKSDFRDRHNPAGEVIGLWSSVFLKLRLNFTAADGSQVSAEGLGHGMDVADKAASKAMTMAMKYCLINVFLIPTMEVDPDGETPEPEAAPKISEDKKPSLESDWREEVLHFSKNKGKKLGELSEVSLEWYQKKWAPKPYNGVISQKDKHLRAVLDLSMQKKAPAKVEETPFELDLRHQLDEKFKTSGFQEEDVMDFLHRRGLVDKSVKSIQEIDLKLIPKVLEKWDSILPF